MGQKRASKSAAVINSSVSGQALTTLSTTDKETMKKVIWIGLTLTTIILLSMGLFSFLKKSPTDPYKDSATNLIYNLLFCDNIDLFKANTKAPYTYPFDILFSEASTTADYQKIIEDPNSDSRLKVLAYNRQLVKGQKSAKKELLGVIIEVGLEDGLDVLASFNDGTARYINHTGKMIIWETTDETSNKLTQDLFTKSQEILKQIGPWNKPRRPHPTKDTARITLLASDGLYFGEGPMDILFNDPLASPALTSGTELMQYLMKKEEDSPNR
jgi:hypothetical protein